MEKVLLAQQSNTTINLSPTDSNFSKLSKITVPGILAFVIQAILVLAGIVAFLYLIIGGVRWITSGGDKEKTAKAQSTITAAVIGLLIVFAAWAIIKLVEAVFGVNILSGTIPTINVQ